MSRLPPISPNELQGDRKKVHDEMTEIASSVFGDKFVYKRSDGAFVGPFAPLVYTPDAGRAFFYVMNALGKINGLPQKARETAILATGAKWKAPYEIYTHERVAVSTTELSQQQIDKIKIGIKPSDLDEDCSIAFDITTELMNKMGPLSDESWKKAEKAFGKEGAVALIHYVGYYSYTCIILNGCDIPLPEGESIK